MKIKLIILLLLTVNSVFAQKNCDELYNKQFTKQQLTADIDFIKEKILNAHANPFTEVSKNEFDKKVIAIKSSLKEGMTQREFYHLAKPLIVTLNDEHSSMADYCIPDSIKTASKYLPLKFKYDNGKMLLAENYSDSNLKIGDEVITLNNIPIGEVLDNCAKAIPGSMEERIPILVDRFWIAINRFCYFLTDDFALKFRSGVEVVVKSLPLEEIRKRNATKNPQKEEEFKPIDYQKIKDFGYLSVNTFNDRQSFEIAMWQKKFDSVFTQIRKDGVANLVIDVQNNSGGNSVIGNMLIDYFSNKSFKTYQGKWKKSQEYANFLKELNIKNERYEKLRNGAYYPIPSSLIKASNNPVRFNGKTFVLVGKNTFSSAMMFGVMVLDNKLAEVVGEIPAKGHPNHFGELIGFKTPNTKLDFLFGVKEWIRPAGNIEPNKLIPNKIIDLQQQTKEEIIAQISGR